MKTWTIKALLEWIGFRRESDVREGGGEPGGVLERIIHTRRSDRDMVALVDLNRVRDHTAQEEVHWGVGAGHSRAGHGIFLGPYQPRTFAVRLAPAPAEVAPPRTRVVSLPYDHGPVSGPTRLPPRARGDRASARWLRTGSR